MREGRGQRTEILLSLIWCMRVREKNVRLGGIRISVMRYTHSNWGIVNSETLWGEISVR